MLMIFTEALCELHAKLATVVRYYDRMLEERLKATYGRSGIRQDYPQVPPTNPGYAHGAPSAPSAPSAADTAAFYGRPSSVAPAHSQPAPYHTYYTQPPPSAYGPPHAPG